MDLFEHRAQRLTDKEAPLAARMRPRTLDEFVGQEHIMAPGRLLRRAIEADRLTSLIFYGPPGTGKTTLAEVIARRTRAHFHALNAVLAGVKDLREAVEAAQVRRGQHGQPTVLFVDEVHRFNKAQQDALLPWVEKGTVILIGATTENPYFEVNKALVSRSRIFQLRPLEDVHLRRVLEQALADPERGYGRRRVVLEEDAAEHLVNVANGDARAALGALELAVETTAPGPDGITRIDLGVAEESIQRRAVLYDKEGDAHFDIISAYIKSLRGSDPDAALYWLARMVYAGEEARFIFRRLLIFASEDVGLARPEGVAVVNACAEAFDRVGMPEGRYHLAHATIFMATAPKSNSTMGFFDALAVVEREREGEVPTHLKDASRDKEGFGHGKGYLYPHAWRDHWVAQQYLPADLQGRVFYNPTDQGAEAPVFDAVHRRRDAQIAAMIERDALGEAPTEALTTSPDDAEMERWVQRTLGDVGEQLGALRDRLFGALRLQRHHVVLDLNAATGLLTWEAARQAAEGGVYARCADAASAQALAQRAATLPELRRPIAFHAPLEELDAALDGLAAGLAFDAIVGRNALLGHAAAHGALAERLAARLHPEGVVALLEGIPAATQRLYALIPPDALSAELRAAWIAAEEALYAREDDPLLAWTPASLADAFTAAGLETSVARVPLPSRRRITPAQLDHWFLTRAEPAPPTRPTLRDQLARGLDAPALRTVEAALRRHLTHQTVPWSAEVAFVVARRRSA